MGWIPTSSWHWACICYANGLSLNALSSGQPFANSPISQPMTAVQAFLPANEISIATAEIFFFQYFGATLFVALGETIFEQTLVPSLIKYAPNIDPALVIHSGGTTLRSIVSAADLAGVLRAYDAAITNTFVSPSSACGCRLSSG